MIRAPRLVHLPRLVRLPADPSVPRRIADSEPSPGLSGWVLAALFGLACLVGALFAPPAHAATALTGVTTISLEGNAANALKKQHVSVAAGAPAQLASDGRVLLPVVSGTVGKHSQVLQSGSIAFRHKVGGKTRAVVASGLRVDLDANPALSAVIGGKRLDLASLDLRRGEYTATPATSLVRIVTTRLSLTRVAAAAIADGLRVTSLKPGLLGVLGTTAGPPPTNAANSGPPATGTPTNPTSTTTAPTGTTQTAPPVDTTVYPAGLVPLARPATAVDLAADTFSWHVRESLVRYLASGSKAPLTASNGATLGPPAVIDGAPPLPYDVTFVPSTGWFDPVSGTARLRFTGKVNLGYPGHGIDIDISDPIVELSGKESRILVTFGGSSATQYKGIGLLANVNVAAVTPAVSGATTTYANAPGAVPADSASTVFAGFYQPGDQFGNFSFSFTRGA